MTDTNDQLRLKAPYADFAGEPIYAGDRMITKDGKFFNVAHATTWPDGSMRPDHSAWRAIYDLPVSGNTVDYPLIQQVGERIQATVVSKVYGGARAGGKAFRIHVLYKTGDADAPSAILDRNGEVVLSCCRHCGRAEIELDEHPSCDLRLVPIESKNENFYFSCSVMADDLKHLDGRRFAAITKGATDVLFERKRQQEEEGFDEEHDSIYGDGQLAFAGAVYATNAAGNIRYGNDSSNEPGAAAPALWPWTNHWWKPTTVRRDLVKAAALIIAEIDRLDREAKRKDQLQEQAK